MNKDLNFTSSDQHRAETTELRDTIMVMNCGAMTVGDGDCSVLVEG